MAGLTLSYPQQEETRQGITLPHEATPPTAEQIAEEKGKFEDYPTIAEYRPFSMAGTGTLPMKNELALKWGTAFSSNPEQVTDIIKKNVPDAKFTTDKYGNPMAVIEGQKYHLNRPDFNLLSATRFGTKALAAAPLAAGAAALAPVEAVGLPLAIGAQVVAGGLSSVGEDLATIAAGAKQPVDVAKALETSAISGAFPVVAKGATALGNLLDKNVFTKLPRGVQTFLKNYSEDLRLKEMKVPDAKSSDLILDDPNLRGFSTQLMYGDTPAADAIESAITARELARPSRVTADINENLGKQTVTEREMDQTLKNFRGVLSDELGPKLAKAKPINPEKVVAQIDEELKTAKGDIRAALIKMRGMLVTEGGTPATLPVRTPITKPDGTVIRYETTAGTPAKPPTYETSAQGLENARVAIDRMIKYGDESLGIKPNALPGKAGVIGTIRKDLSDLLRKNVKGYGDIMGRYSNLYDMIEANEAGANIFKSGKDQIRPDQVEAYLADAETADAFRTGVRSAWQNKLASSPNDVAALRKGMGGEGDYLRQNMELIYGKDAVDNLLGAAERESGYQETAKKLLSARTAGKEAKAKSLLEKTERPVVEDIYGLPNRAIAGALNTAEKWMRGQSGPAFKQGLADFLTAKGPEIGGYKSGFQRAMERQAMQRPIQSVAPAIAPQIPAYFEEKNQASGGRVGHASGGKVGMTAEGLLRDLKRRKVMMANKTEQMLALPDDAVVQALDAAKR